MEWLEPRLVPRVPDMAATVGYLLAFPKQRLAPRVLAVAAVLLFIKAVCQASRAAVQMVAAAPKLRDLMAEPIAAAAAAAADGFTTNWKSRRLKSYTTAAPAVAAWWLCAMPVLRVERVEQFTKPTVLPTIFLTGPEPLR